LSLQRLKKSETTDFQMLKQGTICPGKFIQMSCCWEHFIGRLENESKSVLYKGKSVQEIDISLQLPVRWIMNQVVLTLLCALLFGVSLTHSAGKLISAFYSTGITYTQIN